MALANMTMEAPAPLTRSAFLEIAVAACAMRVAATERFAVKIMSAVPMPVIMGIAMAATSPAALPMPI